MSWRVSVHWLPIVVPTSSSVGRSTARRRVGEHRQSGTALRLLDTLLDWARDRGVREIFLGTTPKFLAAHRFYEKNGFSEIARSEVPPAFPIMTVDKKFYRRIPSVSITNST